MGLQEFRLPDPGEGLVEADIVTWRFAVGDQIGINALPKLSTLDSLPEKLVDRLAARPHDALAPGRRELGVAVKLAE